MSLECEIHYVYARCMLNSRMTNPEEHSGQKSLNKLSQNTSTQLHGLKLELKETLQNLKILKQDQPQLLSAEQSLLKKASKNKYLQAIFLSTISTYKQGGVQKRLLEDCLNILQELKEYEQSLMNIAK